MEEYCLRHRLTLYTSIFVGILDSCWLIGLRIVLCTLMTHNLTTICILDNKLFVNIFYYNYLVAMSFDEPMLVLAVNMDNTWQAFKFKDSKSLCCWKWECKWKQCYLPTKSNQSTSLGREFHFCSFRCGKIYCVILLYLHNTHTKTKCLMNT